MCDELNDIDKFGDEDLGEKFDAATKFVRGISGTVGSEVLLYFYARFKQARSGPCSTPKPGFFDFLGKQKWHAWSSLGSMAASTAMREYVSRLSALQPSWSEMEPPPSPEDRSWVAVSAMADVDEELPDEQKTIFDWVKEGNGADVRERLEANPELLRSKDENGLGLLHWAADRGNAAMLSLLLSLDGSNVDAIDDGGQTALHYASSCGHLSAVCTLLSAGADRESRDAEGLRPVDVADDEPCRNELAPRSTAAADAGDGGTPQINNGV